MHRGTGGYVKVKKKKSNYPEDLKWENIGKELKKIFITILVYTSSFGPAYSKVLKVTGRAIIIKIHIS